MTGELGFGPDFQGKLVRLLLEDGHYGAAMSKFIEPEFFSTPAVAWGWHVAKQLQTKYGRLPSLSVLIDQSYRLPTAEGQLYRESLYQLTYHPVVDEQYLKQETEDFVKRQIFMRAMHNAKDLFNAGRVNETYDAMQEQLEAVRRVGVGAVDRHFIGAEFEERQRVRRQRTEEGAYFTGTNIPELDRMLGGGAWPGFLGCFLAHPKAGKTTTLVNFGATALRSYGRKVLHFVLEGGSGQTADRYDTVISQDLYANVRAGTMDAERFAKANAEYQTIKNNCVLRSFTSEGWHTTTEDLWGEVQTLKNQFGWKADLILIDYIDLVKGPPIPGGYRTTTHEATEATQAVKTLAERAEAAIWSASQVQRPKNDNQHNDAEAILRSADIADCYARARIVDLMGSINQTRAEREAGLLRMYWEIFRDGPADLLIPLQTDFARMSVTAADPNATFHLPTPTTAQPVPLGYGQMAPGYL